jgi:hypothetical protein
MRRRTVARAAVIGGVAYHAGKRGAPAQAGQQEQEEQPETDEQAPPPDAGRDPIEQIKELDELRAQGILTDEEFTAEKKKLLGI